MQQLQIKNQGQEIIATNFWETEHALRGVFYLSINAGAFRLLVPEVNGSTIAEFRTAKDVIISRGPWKAEGGRDALEILFDDGTDDPFAIHLDVRQVDRMPASTDAGRKVLFTAWTKGRDKPVRVYTHDCYYRIVPELPWLKPFGGE